MKKNNLAVINMARIALVSAIYVVLTLAFAPLSFANIQFRFSEVLTLLCFYNPIYILALTIGCFISNLFTPGILIFDLIFGTLHTLVSCVFISLCKKRLSVASLFPCLFSFICAIGISLSYELPFVITTIQVMFGEVVVVLGLGFPLFKTLEKNKGFKTVIDSEKSSVDLGRNPLSYFSILVSVLLLIMFFTTNFLEASSLYNLLLNNASIVNQILSLLSLFLLVVSLIICFIFNKKQTAFIELVLNSLLIIVLVSIGVINSSIHFDGIICIVLVIMNLIMAFLKLSHFNIENK